MFSCIWCSVSVSCGLLSFKNEHNTCFPLPALLCTHTEQIPPCPEGVLSELCTFCHYKFDTNEINVLCGALLDLLNCNVSQHLQQTS